MWKKLFKPDRLEKVDYVQEGNELLTDGKFDQALTSFRLALRESPNDPWVMQQVAICYTRMGLTDQAEKTYRLVLDSHPDAPGAHYGIAFLLLRSGQEEEAAQHLEAFLAHAPGIPEAAEHVNHARSTLADLERGAAQGHATQSAHPEIPIP